MGVKLVSASAGSVEIVPPTTASNYTATLPAGTGSIVVNGINGSIVSGSSVNSTSGTSIDFTSIPSWVKRITVMFNGVSASGSNAPIIQIGSGSFSTSGYTSVGNYAGGSNSSGGATYTTGFGVPAGNASNLIYGHFFITLFTSNTWLCSAVLTANTAGTYYGFNSGGISPTLSGALDRVRITTVGSTDTFDAGSINILYE